ncbi:ATP-dependent RNA helicase DbpA [Pigmentiphaga aceris]|uniref:ATP-dependent RNA helicase DbpA n=1 Tax=Pigmentiphaga aceris TaxID=1940612 RepID=A0A5C0AV91_9BURK|nr:ATP-dependent RNA helicase DbpA [Pigmentiphaga aceris]QEI05524.1 ATP-dependent RNA helicase DbpA [Pigmentiphaga aceris]
MTTSAFSSLPLSPAMLATLDTLGYHNMTAIQAQSLPTILNGRDLIAQAKTGSGKTAAFGIGLLQNLDVTSFKVQALVLCPTRELADQVSQEVRKLARSIPNLKILNLSGGAPMRPQVESLLYGAHVIVGTPGRIFDHLDRGSLELHELRTLVLDEADRMVDMGFIDQISQIVALCPPRRQTLLFSATFPDDIKKISGRLMRNAEEIKVESIHQSAQIEQYFYEIDEDERTEAVVKLLKHFRPESAIAFCNTKAQCRELVDDLVRQGFSALALHGDLEQRDRDDVLVMFANRSCSILVATDVAARGLDIPNLDAVINVEVTRDKEIYVHRIGRTGRSGEKGLALNLASPEEVHFANLIETFIGSPLQWRDIEKLKPAPGDMLRPPMVTVCVHGGKKDKLRPGDFLGALTKDIGLTMDQVGKINITEFVTFVALKQEIADATLEKLLKTNIKGKRFKARFMQQN